MKFVQISWNNLHTSWNNVYISRNNVYISWNNVYISLNKLPSSSPVALPGRSPNVWVGGLSDLNLSIVLSILASVVLLSVSANAAKIAAPEMCCVTRSVT